LRSLFESNVRTAAENLVSGYYKRITDELARDREQRRPATRESTRFTNSAFLKKGLRSTLILVVAALALFYVGDYVLIRYRAAAHKNAYGAVAVQPYYAMHLKNGNTEFSFQPNETQTCVNSVFPHLGMTPCWYLRRHPERRTDI